MDEDIGSSATASNSGININLDSDAVSCDFGSYRGSCSAVELLERIKSLSTLPKASSTHERTSLHRSPFKKDDFVKDIASFQKLLHQSLRDFILAFIVEQPKDVIDFAVQHFTSLQEKRQQNDSSLEVDPSPSGDISYRALLTHKSQNELKDTRRRSVCAVPFSITEFADDDNVDDDYSYDYETINSRRLSIIPKSPEQEKRIKRATKHLLMFRGLQPEQFSGLMEAMQPLRVNEGDIIYRYGQIEVNFYMIDTGTFNVLDKNDRLLTVLENKGVFNELALLHNTETTETVVADSEGLLWVMDHSSFRRILLQHAYKKNKLYTGLLESVALFKELHPFEIANLVEVLKPLRFKRGATIMKQGDEADGMYFIEDGTVTVWKDPDMGTIKSKGERIIATLYKGQYFGETALIIHKPRNASIYCETDVKLAFLDEKSFERLLGKCIDVINRNMEDYNLKDPALITYLNAWSTSRKQLN